MSKKTKMIYHIRWSLQAQVERLEKRRMKYGLFMDDNGKFYYSNKGRYCHITRQLDRLSSLILKKDSEQFDQTHHS